MRNSDIQGTIYTIGILVFLLGVIFI